MLRYIYALLILFTFMAFKSDWGFFGHRTINQYALYTLPQELFGFYKPHAKFVREHAVDPDMRRYALKKEAGRHYIDIDYWGEAPFDNLPRDWKKAFSKMAHLRYINSSNDTIELKPTREPGNTTWDSIFNEKVRPKYFSDEWSFDCNDIRRLYPTIKDCKAAIIVDSLTTYGVLPYTLEYTYNQLVRAFDEKHVKRILRHTADIGHYIGDAHVPLHTTLNYNGQLTGQDGIHAFWESRLPELYALDQYEFVVGQAKYIPDFRSFIWDVILDTHSHLDSTLLIEKRLRESYPKDLQNCFEQRLERTVRIQCEGFSSAYHEALDGMVERQMVKTISALGDVWYSAWVDAGKPNLSDLPFESNKIKLDTFIYQLGNGVHR